MDEANSAATVSAVLNERTIAPKGDLDIEVPYETAPQEHLQIKPTTAGKIVTFHCTWREKLQGTV